MAEKRKVILPIPEATTKEEKAAQSHVKASLYPTKQFPRGMVAGRVYDVDASLAAHLVRRKGWKYVDAAGKPTTETAPDVAIDPRPGTAEWIEKYGEDYTIHDKMLDEGLAAAKKAEAPVQAAPTVAPAPADQAKK